MQLIKYKDVCTFKIQNGFDKSFSFLHNMIKWFDKRNPLLIDIL